MYEQIKIQQCGTMDGFFEIRTEIHSILYRINVKHMNYLGRRWGQWVYCSWLIAL